MSLATRCTACGTAFRVVQDQLKVSEGWVRCGRCSEVFNALEGLFDLDREAPLERQPSAPPGSPASVDSPGTNALEPQSGLPGDAGVRDAGAELPPDRAVAAVPGDGTDEEEHLDPPLLPKTAQPDANAWVGDARAAEDAHDHEIDAHLFRNRRTPRRMPPLGVDERDRLDFSDARFDSDLLTEDAEAESEVDPLRSSLSEAMPLESHSQLPEFVRRAERRARWQRPRVRAGLVVAALALIGGLLLQAGHHFHDIAAARWPALRPALAQWCEMADCRLEAPRRIDEVSVESTALARVPGADAFRLAITLRSHATVPIAVPSVDLSLTDAGGRLVARKALGLHEFEPVAPVLQPGGEVVLQNLLAARNGRVTGYTVEIFYP